MPQPSGKAKKEYLKRKKVQRRERREQDARESEEEREQAAAARGGDGGARSSRPPRRARGARSGGGGGLTPPTSEPLHYVPLVEVAGGARLPVLDLADVGWDDYKLASVSASAASSAPPPPPLPMPTRPDWRAAGVTTAEELHALEEREFERWAERLRELAIEADRKAGLLPQAPPAEAAEDASAPTPSTPLPPLTGLGTPRAGGPGWGAPSLSFFEGRLDFWRQLWRTLEMSDALLVLADSRNPLLHWPAALHARAREKGLPVVLVLSKADLVPQAAIQAWREFFERAYPGLKVVAVAAGGAGASAAAVDGATATTTTTTGRAAARELVSAVLDLEVERGGKKTTVREFVGMGADEVLDHSAARNRHARREVSSRAAAVAAAKGRGKAAGGVEDEEDSEEDEEEDWSVRGTKARKQLAKKQLRQQRKGGGGGGKAAAAAAKQAPQRQKKQQQQQQHEEDDDDSDDESFDGSGTSESGSESSSGSERWSEDEEDDGDEADGSDDDDDPDLARRLKSLTLEGQLLGGGGGAQSPQHQKAKASSSSPPCSPIRHGDPNPDHLNPDPHPHHRPVVVGLVGEPNVGKSSALNALLGAHRVAVSAHPGRTRTYQTHWMAPRLVLCDCPGLVFPRRGVALEQQVLFGSFPIAQCRDPYGVVRYLAERLWPRAEAALRLAPLREEDDDEAGVLGAGGGGGGGGSGAASSSYAWTPLRLCNALAAQRRWRGRRGGRLDTYRAANTILRAALAGRMGLTLAFLPPQAGGSGDEAAAEDGER